MGKSMELLVPMNDDVNIYDGTDINASIEKKSKNTWIEMFDMIDLTFNNLQQQNKELKRTVNELSSKINKMVFHERKETSKTTSPPAKPKNATNGDAKEYTQGQVQEINKKVEVIPCTLKDKLTIDLDQILAVNAFDLENILKIEPTFLEMGPSHFAVGINNQVSYYRW